MAKARVLLVEDDVVAAHEMRVSLTSLGYVIPCVVESGPEAIQSARLHKPDIIVMDITLKGEMDGIQAGKAIQEECGIPIIYLTCHEEEEMLQRAKLTLPYGFLLKPFHPLELYSTLETALYRHNSEKNLQDRERWMAGILNSIEPAVIAVDALGIVGYLNRAAEELTGWKEADAIGRDLPEVCHLVCARTGQELHLPMLEIMESATAPPTRRPYHFFAAEAPPRLLELQAYPMTDPQGALFGLALLLTAATTATVH